MDTQEKILTSALKLFVEHGLSVSTTAITKDAGVSTGILFHYFPTKKDLITTLYTNTLFEYYTVNSRFPIAVTETDPSKFYENQKQRWMAHIDWALVNWNQFIFIQLFEGSILAEQFILENNKKLEQITSLFYTPLKSMIEQNIFKALPIKFLVSTTIAYNASLTMFLHENQQFRDDPDFMEQSWDIYWKILKK
jgi:hypothetical protein